MSDFIKCDTAQIVENASGTELTCSYSDNATALTESNIIDLYSAPRTTLTNDEATAISGTIALVAFVSWGLRKALDVTNIE